MSLDVYLNLPGVTKTAGSGIFVRENGSTVELTREQWNARYPGREPAVLEDVGDDDEVYSQNITHNLGKMAGEAGVYEALWRPDEHGITHARQLVEPLTAGLAALRADPGKYRALNPANGWGTYEGLVAFVADYLEACTLYPEATVRVWR